MSIRFLVTGVLTVLGLITGVPAMALTLTSSAFQHNGFIPAKYTCEGDNISPPLSWNDVPDNTRSFVLILDDPDAPMGTWDHWILYNIPYDMRELAEDFQSKNTLILNGINSWNKTNYGGPCPPAGTHRYVFKLYALDIELSPHSMDKKAIESAIKGHILEETQIVGRVSHS